MEPKQQPGDFRRVGGDPGRFHSFGLSHCSPVEAVWDRVDAQLAAKGPFMLGERLSAVDFLATMLMRWSRNLPRQATAWPNIARYLARMRAMPSLREVHAREGLTDWIDG